MILLLLGAHRYRLQVTSIFFGNQLENSMLGPEF
jgi:hypothetical protein